MGQKTSQQPNCYFGHIKNVFSAAQAFDFVRQEATSVWDLFTEEFFNLEQQKEDKIFKEIDFNENNSQFEPIFEFSIQELHSLYREYLQLSEEAGEEMEEKQESRSEEFPVDNQENQRESENKEEVDDQGLREELT